jgi:hypothetical protein
VTPQIVEAVRRLRAVDEAVARQDWPTPLRMGDVRVVLDELDRLTAQAKRLVRAPREDKVATAARLNPLTKITVVGAECPGCATEGRGIWMQCLSTRRPDETTVRRRWECPRCTGRFTSYDKEEAKA